MAGSTRASTSRGHRTLTRCACVHATGVFDAVGVDLIAVQVTQAVIVVAVDGAEVGGSMDLFNVLFFLR